MANNRGAGHVVVPHPSALVPFHAERMSEDERRLAADRAFRDYADAVTEYAGNRNRATAVRLCVTYGHFVSYYLGGANG